jgi:glycosyltransferase involved in cell wall biosynthesis
MKYAHGVQRYIAISHAVRDVLVRDGVPPGRISVVRSCIDPGRVQVGDGAGLRAELGLDPGAPIVGNVGHLVPHKGQRTLLEAIPRVLREVPETRFVIVGEGELESDLKRRARDLGIAGQVIFPGFRDDVSSFLSIFRIFVMPSHMEGLGTAVLDALAVRLPVIATTAGGIPEMIRDGVNGLLVPVRDPAALARALVSLLRDPARAQALGEEGYRTVRREFSVETMVEQTRGIYQEVLDGKRGG